ncbi:KLHL29 [Branchiostoma lanceolatum]|uniref:KLHL29 protein n=1 Tax=Branchiostoma lanceolatum TaxID=7740 RepID=A0A8K0A944_BRALA|nr:KLHL29 [Branchiostoma lanceolatum]
MALRSALGKVCCCLKENKLEEDVQIGSLEDIRDEDEAQPLIADLFNDEEFLQQDEEKVIDFLASDELMTDKIDCQHVSEDQYDEYFETEVYSEEAVFEAAMTWLEKSKQDEDDKNAANVLQAVRLTLLKPSQLEKLEQHPLVMASTEAQEMIQHVKQKNQEVPVESSDDDDFQSTSSEEEEEEEEEDVEEEVPEGQTSGPEGEDDNVEDFSNGTRRTIIIDIWQKLLQNLREGGKQPQEDAAEADSPEANMSGDNEKTQGSNWNIFKTITRLFSRSEDDEAKSAPEDTQALINPMIEDKTEEQESHTRAKRRWIQGVGKIELQRALKNLDMNPKVRRERLVKSLYIDEDNSDILPIPDIDTLRRPLTLKEEFENTKPWEIVTRMREYEDAIGGVVKPRKFSASIADLADMETCYMYKPRKNTLKGRSSIGKSEMCLEIIERNKVKTNRPEHTTKEPALQTAKPKRKRSRRDSRRVKSVALLDFTEIDLIAQAKEEKQEAYMVKRISNVQDQQINGSQREKIENSLNQEKDEIGSKLEENDSELHQEENENRSTQPCEEEDEPESKWSELIDKIEDGAEEVVETMMEAVTDAGAAVVDVSKLAGTALAGMLHAVGDLVADSSSETSTKKKKEPLDVSKILPTLLVYKPRKGMAEHVFFIFGKPGILCCDADTKSWYKVSSLPEDYVESPSIAANTCMFYLTGGALMVTSKNGNEYKKTVRRGYVYNFMKDKWTKLPRMNTPRYGHTSVVIEGTLYVIGGQDGDKPLVHLEKYNQAAKVWEVCDSADIVSCKPILAACHRHKLYIIYQPNSHQAILRAYHTEKDEWYKRKLELPFEASIFMANEGKLFIVNMNMKKNFPARAKVLQVCFKGKIRDGPTTIHLSQYIEPIYRRLPNPQESPHIIYLLANEYVKPMMVDLHMEENLTAEPIPDTYRVIKYDLGNRTIRDLDKIRVENVHGCLTREKSQVGWYARDLTPCDNFRMRSWKTLEDDTWEVVVKKVRKSELEESESDDADDIVQKTEGGEEQKTEEEQVKATQEEQEGLLSQEKEDPDVTGEQDHSQTTEALAQEPEPGPELIDVEAQVTQQYEQAPEQIKEDRDLDTEQDQPDGYQEGYDEVFEEQELHSTPEDGHVLGSEQEQGHVGLEDGPESKEEQDLESEEDQESTTSEDNLESEEEQSDDESESDEEEDSERETDESGSGEDKESGSEDDEETGSEETEETGSEETEETGSEETEETGSEETEETGSEETEESGSEETEESEEEQSDVGSEDDESEEETDDVGTGDLESEEEEDHADSEDREAQNHVGSEGEADQESVKELGSSRQGQDKNSEEEGAHLGYHKKDITDTESEIEEEQGPFSKLMGNAQEPEKNQYKNGEGGVETEKYSAQGNGPNRLNGQRTPGQIIFYGSDDSEVEDLFSKGQQDTTVNKDEPPLNIKYTGQHDNATKEHPFEQLTGEQEKKESKLEQLKELLGQDQDKDSNRGIPSEAQDQEQEQETKNLGSLNKEQDEDSDEIEAM